MPHYQIMMQVPEVIHQGIQSGTMVRNAAGIVRTTGGVTPGAIIAHLREVGPASVTQTAMSPLLVSTGALAAVQIASTVFLSRKLNKIEALTRQVLNETHLVFKVVDEIREEQTREIARNVWRAFEFLKLWVQAAKKHDLSEANKHFVRGKADVCEALMQTDAEKMLEEPERCQFLVNAAIANSAGQLLVMNHLDYPVEVQLKQSEDYVKLFDAKAEALLAIPAPPRRLPSVKMLEATANGGGPLRVAKSWRDSLDAVSRSLEAEVRLIHNIADVTSEDLESFSRQLEQDGKGAYCLLVSDAVNLVDMRPSWKIKLN